MLRKNLALICAILLASSCSSKAVKSPTLPKEEVKNEQSGQIVFFDFNSSVLSSDAKSILDKKVLSEVKTGSTKIKVEGHCDERGSVAYNISLGKKRADAVKKYLVENGVKSSRIRTVSYGESKPVDFAHTEEAWAKNRRAVTIEVKK